MTQNTTELHPVPDNKEYVNGLVQRLREQPTDPDARIALCDVAVTILYRRFRPGWVGPADVEEFIHDVITGMLKTCSTTGLDFRYNADSFYSYINKAAKRRLAKHWRDRRRLPRPVGDPRLGDTASGYEEDSRTGRDDLLTWIRDTTSGIPDDLDLVLMSEAGISAAGVAGMKGWTTAHVHHRLHRARSKVAGRMVARHVATARWPRPDRRPDDDVCLGLQAALTWDKGRRRWDPEDPYGFTEQVYRRILKHAGVEKPRCIPCADALAEAHRNALRRRWLALPLLLVPPGLVERVRLTAAEHATDAPMSWAPPPPGPRGPIALGAAIGVIGLVIWALMGDPPTDGLVRPNVAAPPRPIPSAGSAGLGAPSSGPPKPTPSNVSTTPSRQPSPQPTGTVAPVVQPLPTATSATPSKTIPPLPDTPITDLPITDLPTGPTEPSTNPTDGPTTDPTDPPPTLEVGLAAAVGVCAPAYRCDSTPGVAPTRFEGDCSAGVAVNFRATVTVNTTPAKVTVRWVVDGTPRRNVHLEFPASGPESQYVSRTFVIKDPSSSGKQIASIAVRDPVSAAPATAEATVVCT